MPINYVIGDCLQDVNVKVCKLIPHCVNNQGGWGKGVVLAISKKWPSPEQKYREWYKTGQYNFNGISIPFQLGQVQFVKVEPKVVVCNMLAQEGIGLGKDGFHPLRYSALVKAMVRVGILAKKVGGADIHAPKFGAGLAAGRWDFIEELINEIWVREGINTTIYQLK